MVKSVLEWNSHSILFVTARDKRGHFAAKFKIELYIPAFSPGYVAHSGEGLTHVRPMVA